ncbi:MAG TPA: Fic/DOC family N-terminal domain-containing protein [Solirubrobacteraceae bacterium]|nr:Fic/DOC family N-terminal domain-containing protein [Solirubrobacteraceae bacterium]
MDESKFVSAEFGRPYRNSASGWDFVAFRPEPLPRKLTFESETVLALSMADAALGRLAGAGRQIHDPNMFIRPYVTREALASSRIEGTQASLSDVFEADAGEEAAATADVREVWNYRSAMEAGLQRMPDLPLVGRLVRDIHSVLMYGVRGEEKRPGEFRDRPVWIGSPTDSPENAVFVPPLPREMQKAWKDWEAFSNSNVRLPTLVQCALLHYQFETIHPFLDGNGRVGRLLIVFFLIHRGALPAPLLYLSSYLEEHRREYYERLQAVRERGEVQEWLQFFLTAVAVQSEDAIARAEHLHDLRETYRAALAGSRSRAVEVVDLLFGNPVVSSRRVSQNLGLTTQGALNLIHQLEERGWLERMRATGRGGLNFWIAPQIFSAVSDPAPPLQRHSEEVTLS